MGVIDNILLLDKPNSKDICKAISERVRQRRLELNLTQEGMSQRSGINISSYRRFERHGLISLEGLIKISFVIGMEDDFDKLFAQRIYNSIDDVVRAASVTKQRGTKK